MAQFKLKRLRRAICTLLHQDCPGLTVLSVSRSGKHWKWTWSTGSVRRTNGTCRCRIAAYDIDHTMTTTTTTSTTMALPTSTFQDLPPELVVEIFSFCAATSPLSPLALTQVCALWREIVIYSPQVWQVINLNGTKHSVETSHRQCAHWLQRSRPLPFDILVDVDTRDDLLPLLSPVLGDIGRCRSLIVCGEHLLVAEPPFPSSITLNGLVIQLHSEDDADQNNGSILPSSMFTSPLPLDPTKLTLTLSLTRLPQMTQLDPLYVTILSISEMSLLGHPSPSSILGILSACPVLEQLYYTGWIHDDDHSDRKSCRVVNLPHLRTLSLRSTCLARPILSHIHTPQLQSLLLSYLNVDFVIPSSLAEDGDSDDEHADFSQSPFSDRATGMGLRTLLKRSNPPLRVLEMDYTDMRTKDFEFVFDRLTHLEEFYIVASDMSDKVIQLLCPKRSGGRLRLPALQSLELIHCHRLTGAATVEALSSRLQLTGPGSLESIGIHGCDLITHPDLQLLRRRTGRNIRSDGY